MAAAAGAKPQTYVFWVFVKEKKGKKTVVAPVGCVGAKAAVVSVITLEGGMQQPAGRLRSEKQMAGKPDGMHARVRTLQEGARLLPCRQPGPTARRNW